jgi:hypothetical protein
VFPDCPRQTRAAQAGTPEAKQGKTGLSTPAVSFSSNRGWVRCYGHSGAASVFLYHILQQDPILLSGFYLINDWENDGGRL